MKHLLYAGPFEIEVTLPEGYAPRDLKTRELRQAHLRFFFNKSEKITDRLVFEIQDHVDALSEAPFDAIELAENWRVWRRADGKLILQIWSGENRAYSIEALIDADFHRARIFCLKSHWMRDLLEFHLTTTSIWIISQVAVQHGGFMLHGAAIQLADGSVFLGSGPSGAGKSTLSRFFARAPGFRLLTDERALVLRESGVFQAYGTPWPGMLSRSLNAGGPIRGLYFLEKTKEHVIRPLSRDEAAVRLLSEIFLPPWHEQTTERALSSMMDFLGSVPCRALGFQKKQTIVPFMKEHA